MMDFDGYSVMCLLWKVSWQAAIFAAVVWTVTRLARKAPARFRHALWLLVLVKFLIPPFAHLPAELAVWQRAKAATPAAIVTSPAPIRAAYVPTESKKPSPQPDIVVPPTSQPVSPALPSPWDIAAIIWLAGVGLMAAALIIRCMRQRLSSAVPIPPTPS
jgi:beta-lactamase regulating signal transducer with metallopeptidase domain